MSENVFTLDAMRLETQKKFAPFKIQLGDGSEVSLSSALRLDSDDRKTVQKALQEISDINDEEDDSPETFDRLIEAISKVFNAIADKPAKLLKDLDDEDQLVKTALMSRVLSAWADETQLGEA